MGNGSMAGEKGEGSPGCSDHLFGEKFLVQPEASSRSDSRTRSSELASDKLYEIQ